MGESSGLPDRGVMSKIQKGMEIDLEVEKLAFGGKALCRHEGVVVFVEGAAPGQLVRARVVRKKKQYAEAQVTEVIRRSPRECEPFCPHFGLCGGCQWQHIPYEDQLSWKRRHVLECLHHLAGSKEAMVESTVASPRQQWYRNKMEYTFSERRWLSPGEIATGLDYDRSFALGLHARGRFDRIFDVEACFLESPESVSILGEVRQWCRNSGLPPYTTRTHQGFWRFLVIREGKRTGDLLIHLITATHPRGETVVDGLALHLREVFPSITTFVHSVSQKKAQVAVGDSSRIVFGTGFIEERLKVLRFRISAHSFFQTNPLAAEGLYEAVLECSGLNGHETVWDLYCGTGSISLFIAPHAREVLGFEIVEDAIEDAYVNCRLNGVDNCRFRAGDLKEIILKALRESGGAGRPDVVVTDPPRSGMHPAVVQALRELAPRRIVAVSCNPATLARDLAMLSDVYTIGRVQPFDLFPHTPHIECVVRLDRKE
jgi:23S rRNA (uracil1939-C5)-methyltransferase